MFKVKESDGKTLYTDSSIDLVLGVEGDGDTEVKLFEIPRYSSAGVDLSNGSIRVNYTNCNGELGMYAVPSNGLTINDDTIIAQWLIKSSVCATAGTLPQISICSVFADADTEEITEAWGSSDFKSCVVLEHTCAYDQIPASALADALASAIAQIDEHINEYAKETEVEELKEDLTKLNNSDKTQTAGYVLTATEDGVEFKEPTGGSGGTAVIPEAFVTALQELFTGVAIWDSDKISNPSEKIAELSEYASGATLSSISAVYTGGDVEAGTATADIEGLTVTATYSDGSTLNVTSYTLSPSTIAEGENTITVTYKTKTTTFTVTGTASKTLESISAVDNQTSYAVGTDASNLDLTVTATYSDGTSQVVTGWTASGTVASGENTFTIEYGGKTCAVTVTGVVKVYGVDLTWQGYPDYNKWSANGDWFHVSYNSTTAAVQVANGFATEKVYSKAVDGNSYKYIRIPCKSGNEYSVLNNVSVFGCDSADALTEANHPVTKCTRNLVGFYAYDYSDDYTDEGFAIFRVSDAYDYYYIEYAQNNSLSETYGQYVGIFDANILNNVGADPTE